MWRMAQPTATVGTGNCHRWWHQLWQLVRQTPINTPFCNDGFCDRGMDLAKITEYLASLVAYFQNGRVSILSYGNDGSAERCGGGSPSCFRELQRAANDHRANVCAHFY